MTYTVKGAGWKARWESRSAPEKRVPGSVPSRRAIRQMHAVARGSGINQAGGL